MAKVDNKPFAPPATRIYAIGDIHGSIKSLEQLQAKILEYDVNKGTVPRKILIYLGDYIDRGNGSKKVIDYFIKNQLKGFETIYIMGNHEYSLLRFIEDPVVAKSWLLWGGDATIKSYGINFEEEIKNGTSLTEIANKFKSKIPESHMKFYKNLKLTHIEGDYIFAHAGLRPEIAINEQKVEDILMIREEFIESDFDFGKTVVFGHTIFPEPYLGPGRIGIDTGAYLSGKLTAAVLENNKISFIHSNIK